MTDWGIALIGVGGIIVGAIITEVRYWLDRKQRFRTMTFEKRLQAHQEALSYCHKLNHSLTLSKDEEEKNKTINEIEKWWENNCLLLDEKSRRKMLDLIGDARDHIHGFAESPNTVFRTFRESIKAITQGIGAKHLPEISKNESNFK